jgi:hypothetical protein
LKTLKKITISIGVITFSLLLFVVVLRSKLFFEVRSTPIAKEFYALIDDGDNYVLDLRKIQTVDYDELAFWPPYEDICSLGIEEFNKNGSNCKKTSDDGECYLLFLKNNKLVGKVQIARREVDFAASEINWRVLKRNALFQFLSKNNFPKVKLHALQN